VKHVRGGAVVGGLVLTIGLFNAGVASANVGSTMFQNAYGLCLDAESDANGNPADNGDSVQVWTCDGGTNQRWNFNENNGSYGTVTNDDGGLCLDAQSDATHSPGDTGDRVQLWKCNGGAQQEWRPGTLSNGAVVLVNLESSILLDGNSLLLQATSDNTHSPLTPGDPVELWQSNSSLAQHWSYDS
jgi:hypothetical protein